MRENGGEAEEVEDLGQEEVPASKSGGHLCHRLLGS